jgi:hypothetical protein
VPNGPARTCARYPSTDPSRPSPATKSSIP